MRRIESTSDYLVGARGHHAVHAAFWRRVLAAKSYLSEGARAIVPETDLPCQVLPTKCTGHGGEILGMRRRGGWKFVVQLSGSGVDPDVPVVGHTPLPGG